MCASDFILVKLPCFAQQMCTNQYKQVQSTLNYQFLHAYVYKFIQMCTNVTSSQPIFPIFAYIYLQVHTNLCKQLHSGLNNQFLHAYIYKYIQVCASDSILAFNSNSCMQISTSSYKCVQATSIWHKLPYFACIYRQVYTNVYI